MFKEKAKKYLAMITESEYKVAFFVSMMIVTIWTLLSLDFHTVIFAMIATILAIGGMVLYSKKKDTEIDVKDYLIAAFMIFFGSVFIESISFLEIVIVTLIFAAYHFLKDKQTVKS